MKAALLTKLDSPLELADVEPSLPRYGQVLVRILASGICGAQLQEIAGQKGNAKFIPHLLGHEGCGIVESTGPEVRHVKPGDKVVLHWRKADGIESDFPTYTYAGRQIRSGKVITFAEQALVSENRVTPIPQDTSTAFASLLGCGLSTALGTVERDASLRFGESVLILGVGGLGVNLILASRIAGACPIVAVDQHASKYYLSTLLGAAFHPDLSAITATFDVIIDTTGSPSAIAQALPMLAPSGRFIMVGQPPPDASVTLASARHMFDGEGKTIRATQGGGFQPHLDIPRYVRIWKSGFLNINNIISATLPLDRINEGIDMVRSGHASRVIIEP